MQRAPRALQWCRTPAHLVRAHNHHSPHPVPARLSRSYYVLALCLFCVLAGTTTHPNTRNRTGRHSLRSILGPATAATLACSISRRWTRISRRRVRGKRCAPSIFHCAVWVLSFSFRLCLSPVFSTAVSKTLPFACVFHCLFSFRLCLSPVFFHCLHCASRLCFSTAFRLKRRIAGVRFDVREGRPLPAPVLRGR